MNTDVAIVGAGPAGLFAARELAEQKKLSILVIEQGYEPRRRVCPATTYKGCTRCAPCNIMSGVGGAGTLSSGLLNLRPDIGGNLFQFTRNQEEAWNLIKYVDQIFLRYGAPEHLYTAGKEQAENLERKAAAVDVKYISIPQRHIGSDNAPKVIERFQKELEANGVKFLLGSRVKQIDKGRVTLEDETQVKCRHIIAAPGRCGANWLNEEARRLKIPTRYEPIDIGVRVEVPAVVMTPIIEVSRDPKFHIHPQTYDDFVRTFCVNHEGFVCQEVYDSFVGVNGHSMTDKKSQNTNFAFLVRIKLTQPLEDTTVYARTIAMQVTTLGGGRPLLQRLGDLTAGRRSTWDRIERGNVVPTLTNVTPGDIAMAFSHRIVTDILEGLEKLNNVIPGVASASTLLYAPEVKFSANLIRTNKDLETPIENVFVAGDGAGLSRGLVTAAATGVLAARGVLKKEGIEPTPLA